MCEQAENLLVGRELYCGVYQKPSDYSLPKVIARKRQKRIREQPDCNREIAEILEKLNDFTHLLPIKIKPLVPEAYNDESEKDPGKRCVICLDKKRDTLIKPCKHICLCTGCARGLENSIRNYTCACPICREPVKRIIRVYEA